VSRRPGPILTAIAAAAPVLLGACLLSATTPRAGRPVEVKAGQALVFGRIRLLDERSADLRVFTKDPLEHLPLVPHPAFHLELRGLRPPGGAVRYAVQPSPEIGGDGSFHWVLAHGDYAIASNPRPYGSKRFDPAETAGLARFTVPQGAGTVYLGTLDVVIRPELGLVETLRGEEILYAFLRSAVVTEETAFAALLSRYPSIPEPRVTAPMVPEP
jgi:hypothetical protein